MSKGYTIQFFIRAISNATNRQLNEQDVYSVVSPRFGGKSVKADALDNFLGEVGTAVDIQTGVGNFSTLGTTPRARLLKALRNRSRFGTVVV